MLRGAVVVTLRHDDGSTGYRELYPGDIFYEGCLLGASHEPPVASAESRQLAVVRAARSESPFLAVPQLATTGSSGCI